MKLGPIEFTEAGVVIPKSTTYDDFEKAAQVMAMFRRQSPHWFARLAHEGQRRFGDRFWHMLVTGDASLEDIGRLAAVCAKIPQEHWNPKLSWTHHIFASTLPLHRQVDALAHAEHVGLNSGKFRIYCATIRAEYGK